MLLKNVILTAWILMLWDFRASNEILSFAILLFLWDNASQKLRIPSHFTKCEPLIRTLRYTSHAGLRSFYKPPKKFELKIWAPIPIQLYENMTRCDTGSDFLHDYTDVRNQEIVCPWHIIYCLPCNSAVLGVK